MRKIQEFKETTNSRVYRLLNKEVYSSCSFCRWHPNFWHPSENQKYKFMHYFENIYTDNIEGVYDHYNWKLSSKNKKQWMKKNYNMVKKRMYHSDSQYYVTIIF